LGRRIARLKGTDSCCTGRECAPYKCLLSWFKLWLHPKAQQHHLKPSQSIY